MSSPYVWQYAIRRWLVGRAYAARRLLRINQPAHVPITPRRVLLIVTGLIGDTVMCTPTILEAKRAWPGARLTVLAFPPGREVLVGLNAIDELLETRVVPFTIRQRGVVRALKRELAERNFDVAIILLGDQFAAALSELGIPIRVGVRGDALAPALTHTYDIRPRRTWGPEQRVGALRALGIEADTTRRPHLAVTAAEVSDALRRLSELGLSQSRPFVIVHPFGRLPRQWWNVELCADLAEQLEREGVSTVIVGGPEYRGALSQIRIGAAINAVGSLTLRQLMGALANASCVITTDSGPYHLAGALRRPIVSLMRSARPEYATLYPETVALLGTHPACETECNWEYCAAAPCRQLMSLTTDHVLAATRTIGHPAERLRRP